VMFNTNGTCFIDPGFNRGKLFNRLFVMSSLST
jgi:hypothetical protein